MKNFWINTLVLSLIVALSGCDSEQQVSYSTQSIIGQIKAIDGQTLTLALADSTIQIVTDDYLTEDSITEWEASEQTKVVYLSEDTLITAGKENLNCQDLLVGDWIKCRYDTNGDETVINHAELLEGYHDSITQH